MKRTLFALLLLATPASATELDTVRSQFIAYYTAQGADASAPRMRDAFGALQSVTKEVTAPGFLLSDGSWSDINYDERPDGGWGPWDHTRRLIVMAKAYRTPGQPFFGDPTLRAQIEAALVYTKRFYGTSEPPLGNWWFWTIGIPIDLAPTLILMRDDIDTTTFDDLVKAIHLRIGSSPTGRGIVGPIPTGQNLVWSSFTHLCLALLKDDPAMLAAVRDAMATVTHPTNGDGIKRDLSFHQHGAQLYTGGYGASFANDVARHALITRGTSYALPANSLASFSDYVVDGIAWSMYGNYFDVSVISREVARPTTTGFNGIAALLQASEFQSPRKNEIRAAAAKMLQTWGSALPTELAGLAAKIEGARPPAAMPTGHRHYFNSDYTVHRNANWFASVKMFSKRTKSGESTNNENIRGSRQSDGRFYLVLEGSEYFGRNVWPALDWTRLPGITVEQKPDAASNDYDYGSSSFAGGTGDGRNGVSAMELEPIDSVLRARKSWFFFDDSIVFLTNGITAPTLNRVETVVNQWPLMNRSSQLVRRDNWAHLENVGYWFPSPVDVKSSREERTGTWAALGGSDDTTPHTNSFVTMWIDHGLAPVNASAEYVIVPNVSQAAMSTWAASRPLSILANNDTVSAVRDNRTGALGIIFWRAGSIEGIQSSGPALVYIAGERIHVADPNAGTTGTIQLTIPGRWSSDFTTSLTSRSTTLTIPRQGGQTTSIALTEAPPVKRRSVR